MPIQQYARQEWVRWWELSRNEILMRSTTGVKSQSRFFDIRGKRAILGLLVVATLNKPVEVHTGNPFSRFFRVVVVVPISNDQAGRQHFPRTPCQPRTQPPAGRSFRSSREMVGDVVHLAKKEYPGVLRRSRNAEASTGVQVHLRVWPKGKQGLETGEVEVQWGEVKERASGRHEGSRSSTTLGRRLLSHKRRVFQPVLNTACKHRQRGRRRHDGRYRTPEGGVKPPKRQRVLNSPNAITTVPPNVQARERHRLKGFRSAAFLMCNKPSKPSGRLCGLPWLTHCGFVDQAIFRLPIKSANGLTDRGLEHAGEIESLDQPCQCLVRVHTRQVIRCKRLLPLLIQRPGV